tara:strand:- start:132 stop:959 length:828 start_codon:yes stop_codon:yes gene_type:complete
MLCFPRLGDYGYLGNAMFQYSALIGIAEKLGYNPVYDFEKTGTMATLHEHFNLTKVENLPAWEQVHSSKRIWKEPHFHFCEEAFSPETIRENTGLNGYFQSEKYFKHIENDIRSEFKFSDEIQKDCDSKIKQIKDSVEDCVTVGVHVRLGDYKSLEHFYVPLLKTPYYRTAIDLMNQKEEKKVVCVIFSDEIEMCRQFFQGSNFAFAEGGSPAEDMCLMSKCDHNIIANSSFSWWGAWLNENENKQVIAPQVWFTPNEKEQKDIKDLYCENWTIV